MYRITRADTPVGDHLLTALFTHILNDNGIAAVFDEKYYRHIIDCPFYEGQPNCIDYEFIYCNGHQSILESGLEFFKNKFGIRQKFIINRDKVPVKFSPIPKSEIPAHDVAIVSKSGKWSSVRDWPYFDQLKHELTRLGLSWIDLTEKGYRDNRFLNYVYRSKVFVTLETGPSHLASSIIDKKNSILIQSGYCYSDKFWNFYRYDVIDYPVECRGCFKRSCDDPKCMKNIAVDRVLNTILLKLHRSAYVK